MWPSPGEYIWSGVAKRILAVRGRNRLARSGWLSHKPEIRLDGQDSYDAFQQGFCLSAAGEIAPTGHDCTAGSESQPEASEIGAKDPTVRADLVLTSRSKSKVIEGEV